MIRPNQKWSALSVLLIALPAGFLTYFSARSFQSEQRAAIAGINLLVPDLQQQLDQLVEDLAATAADIPSGRAARAQVPGIEFVFQLDESGQLRYPRYLPVALAK